MHKCERESKNGMALAFFDKRWEDHNKIILKYIKLLLKKYYLCDRIYINTSLNLGGFGYGKYKTININSKRMV